MSEHTSRDGGRVGAALALAVQAEREQEEHLRRAGRTEADLAAAQQQLDDKRAALADESADVARLESFSPTRIWAALRGSRDEELDRERAEQQQAEYAVAVALAQVERLVRERDAARAEAHALGDVAERKRLALADVEAWMAASAHPSAARLAELATSTGTLAAERHELLEAVAAADEARAALGRAAAVLSSASGWSTMDTFFGGGLITDMVKYDKVDQAQRLMQAAGQALQRLRRELADVGAGADAPGLEIGSLLQTFDVWFDNVFSDWAVRSRIAEAEDGVAAATAAVTAVRTTVATRLGAVDALLASARVEREELLRDGAA